MRGIAYTTAVKIARERGSIIVNLYDEGRMTAAVKRAYKKGLLVRDGGKASAARFVPFNPWPLKNS